MLQLNDLLPPSKHETFWTFYGFEHPELPRGSEYVVFEYYCNKLNCDCNSLVAEIMRINTDGNHIKKSLAIIDYDWSTTESACKPALHPDSPRTNLASYILEVYTKMVHNEEYLHRIKKQYSSVKSLMLAKSSKHNVQKINQTKKTGRNDPCDCGSGKKYKKCCLVDSQPELFRIV